jgi:hypothetical protein
MAALLDAGNWSQALAVCALVLQLALGLVFLASSVHKLLHLDALSGTIYGYRLLPAAVIAPVGWLILLLEAAIAVALLARTGVAPAAAAGCGLLTLFALAMAINLLRGRSNIDCGCTPLVRGQRLQWRLVVRNGLLALALLLSIAAPAPPASASVLSMLLAAVALFALHHALAAVWALQSLQRRAAFEAR